MLNLHTPYSAENNVSSVRIDLKLWDDSVSFGRAFSSPAPERLCQYLPAPVPLSTYKCKGPVILMSDGHPGSSKVREACQHPICPSTCLLPSSLCFWHCVWSGVWVPMLLAVCSSPGSQAWGPPVVLFIVGIWVPRGAFPWPLGEASLATAEVLYICLWQELSGLDKFYFSLISMEPHYWSMSPVNRATFQDQITLLWVMGQCVL